METGGESSTKWAIGLLVAVLSLAVGVLSLLLDWADFQRGGATGGLGLPEVKGPTSVPSAPVEPQTPKTAATSSTASVPGDEKTLPSVEVSPSFIVGKWRLGDETCVDARFFAVTSGSIEVIKANRDLEYVRRITSVSPGTVNLDDGSKLVLQQGSLDHVSNGSTQDVFYRCS